jgi:molybdate transport system ATP-binding protein
LSGVASKLRIEPILDRDILSISSGEMMKTLIARALLKNPRLLVLDEPYEGLDRHSRSSLKKLLEGLIDDDVQTILITHKFEEMMSNISHVLLLKNGGVYHSGEKEKVLTSERIADLYGLNSRLPAQPGSLPCVHGKRENSSRGYTAEGGMAAGEVLIRMKDTTVRYKDVVVLERVNWTVRQGENWMILGPNGAGKTTMLKLILGENLQGYANEIYLFGRRKGSGENIWDIKRNIGFISSELQAHYPTHLSAFDVVCSGFFDSIGLFRLCSDEQKDTARAWIHTLGIASLTDQYFGQLSHGQRRLVLIARAMVKSPVLLMLDEPCDGLDMANRHRLMDILDFIGANTNTNLIYVTHHEEETLPCFSHILFMDKGNIVKITAVPQSEAIQDKSQSTNM